ncbi:hypothetical protein [Robertmurraya kyonggiensis]|uniref:Uncharacterized protein n=1 Tax=Robertmurraya kyonggiensis TaxID=1037680 RepID=A0A4U1DE00_9BACI|nr:hypothetical protein [Robertmurraya kyonggiensis]TKC19626.1 hypothetical protein FA727_08840 [Robertmurraya kyonggiensis]
MRRCRFQFEPPTEHYDKRIESIDEQICDLIKQRKEVSSNDPGFPSEQLISSWSEKYNFYEDFLNSVFAHFFNEDRYKPVVEPIGFLKNIPILKSFENDDVFYSVTFVRQFENASVVHFNIDREDSDDEVPRRFREPLLFDLVIEGKEVDYECRNEGGGGSGGHESYTFIVSPALPDDLSEIKLIFKESKPPFKKPTGFEFVI